MPDIRQGDRSIDAIYHGSLPVERVYWGDTLIWPNGLIVRVPANLMRMTSFAPSIHLGAAVAVPLSAMNWLDFGPTDAVITPTDTAVWRDYAPSVFSSIEIPLDVAVWTDYAPAYVGPTVDIKPPVDAVEWTEFRPSLFATVTVPASQMHWTDYAPAVASGASVVLDVDAMVLSDYAPGSFGFDTGFTIGFQAPPVDVGVVVPVDAVDWTDYPAETALDPATREFRATKTLTGINATSFTVTSCDVGAADTSRYVVACIQISLVNNQTVSAVTIGGVSARINVQTSLSYASAYFVSAIVSAKLEAGTTADVAVTLSGGSGASSSCRVSTYRTLGLQSNVELDNDTDLSTSGNSKTLNVDVTADGLAFVSGILNSSSNPSYSGATFDYALTVGGWRISGGSLEVAANESNKAFGITISGGTGAASVVAASFR